MPNTYSPPIPPGNNPDRVTTATPIPSLRTGMLGTMPRRVLGDPSVPPWPGSADEQAAQRVRAEQAAVVRERRDRALAIADFGAAEAAGFDPGSVRRLAEVNGEFNRDLTDFAKLLNDESMPPGSAREWTRQLVAECIGALWPSDGEREWPRSQLGQYPGYLGPLRENPGFLHAFDVQGPHRGQFGCQRCGAEWPPGWPGTGAGMIGITCPDCLVPGGRMIAAATEHSIIDLHWLIMKYAPRPVSPCPTCGAERVGPRALQNPSISRTLYWVCPNGDTYRKDAHFMAALEYATFDSPAAHFTYWLAVDALRARTDEVTDLPIGAVYTALDGSGERWQFGESGWTRMPSDETRPLYAPLPPPPLPK
ncbi:hypothetical protein [Nocardia sp. NPDC056000]|uniref:hypothetical protein n=1 Tax=Nocardia sp. NPDC056000 TaxID=3345674 RepID=UPI0035DC1733